MAYAALTNVVDKVGKLLSSSNDNFISAGAEHELQWLFRDFCLLKAWFDDTYKPPGKQDEFFREVERQIMRVAYEAEDAIDSSLELQVSNRKSASFLAREVRYLRQETVELLERARRAIGDRPYIGVYRRSESIERELPTLIEQENIIGFEHEKDIIIGYLREPSNELDVMSIIGMAGLGKTTLARKIYADERTCYEFPIRIWVYASEMFNRKDVFLQILTGFTSRDMSYLSDEDLAHRAYVCLQEGKKFLLVIDDVCSVDDWNAIRHVLPNKCHGKVLITSRYTNVGKHANPTREPLRLGFLTKEQSWELLQYEVFGSPMDCPRELMGIGECIAKQCDGLPLAIIRIGQILQQRLSGGKEMDGTIDLWNRISEDLSKFLKYQWELGDTILEDVHNMLPYDLRVCFLYLGVFPINYEIPVWTLINLWIAEGFIQHKPGMSLEETAEKNFMDLVNRNLVMVDKTNPMGKVKTCRVHVAISAFCRSTAAEWNLFQEIKMSTESYMHRSYRVCVHSDLLEFLSRRPRSRSLRSILCFYKKHVILDSEYISAIADDFFLLRVLATNSIKFTEFPKGITRLIHLSYITLCGDDLEVPEAFSRLRSLRTVVVDTQSLYLTIKANIWKMVLLKHVKTKAAIILDIQGNEGDAHENLQTLSRLSTKSCTVGVLSKAKNLQKLGIRGQLATLDTRWLSELHRLEKLKLVNDLILSDATSQSRSHGLPHSTLNYFPTNLKTLTLSATYLNWEHMSTLGKIDTLRILKLINYAFTGELWNSAGDPGFRSLIFLLIASTDLVLWEATTDDFPSLRCLVLKNCEKLNRIPKVLVKSLKKLDIENLSITAVESAREIEKEKGSAFKLSIGPECE